MQNLEQAALPEREEENGFHCDELVEGIEGRQTLLGRLVEEDQKVEREGHRDVVNEAQPWEPTVQVVGAVAEHAVLVKQDGKDGSYWLDEDEL